MARILLMQIRKELVKALVPSAHHDELHVHGLQNVNDCFLNQSVPFCFVQTTQQRDDGTLAFT